MESLRATYNESLVTDGCREVSIEGDSVVVRIISLISDDVFQEHSLVPQNLRQSSASTRNYKKRAKSHQCLAEGLLVERDFGMLVCQLLANIDCTLPSFSFT